MNEIFHYSIGYKKTGSGAMIALIMSKPIINDINTTGISQIFFILFSVDISKQIDINRG
jgi:hypothetical protein